jgi:hypothetical protein
MCIAIAFVLGVLVGFGLTSLIIRRALLGVLKIFVSMHIDFDEQPE